MLSFTLSGKHMTYTETHALILNHNKHKQEQISKSSGNSYNTFTYIFILVTNLCFFRYLDYGTELIRITTYTYLDLILMTNLFLFQSLVGHVFIPISRKTHTYLDFLVCSIELIHILIRRYLSTYSYLSQAYTCFDLP